MRYFCDTEYDGFGGKLLSIALVPEDESDELYLVLDEEVTSDWVARNVVPYFQQVPDHLKTKPMKRGEAAQTMAQWLAMDEAPEIIADWPEDLAQFSMLLVTGPGQMLTVPELTLRFVPVGNFSAAENSAVPHNALHDARALRDYYLSHLD